VVSHLLVGGGGSGGIIPQKIFVFFYPYDCNSLHFLKQIFGYIALHYAVDRLNLQLSTCIVCLCRYHNLAVTQGASLINLVGLTPTKRHHGWHRVEEFGIFKVFSIPLLLGPFINSFIMVCESMLSASQDGLLYEKCFLSKYHLYEKCFLSKYHLQIFDYILYEYSNSNFIPLPLIKHWVGGLLPPASLTCLAEPCNNSNLYGLGKQSSGKCLKSNKVFTTQCLALKIKDMT
jgi:hypothetical protein